MIDLAGTELHTGDIVTDSRGKLFRIKDTPGTVQAQRIAYAQGVRPGRAGLADTGPATSVRLYNALRVVVAVGADYAAYYKRAWDQHQQQVVHGEIRGHKARVAKSFPKGETNVAPVPDKAGFYCAATWERIVPDYKKSIWKQSTFAISYDGRLTHHYMTCNLQRHLSTVKTKGWEPVKVLSKHKDTRALIAAFDRWATKHGYRSVIK